MTQSNGRLDALYTMKTTTIDHRVNRKRIQHPPVNASHWEARRLYEEAGILSAKNIRNVLGVSTAPIDNPEGKGLPTLRKGIIR